MSLLLHGDCLEHLHGVDDDSVDLIFCDLPYGQISCSWDQKIDLTKLWEHFMRIKKLNTPLFFTTTTKFGVELIQSAPKKCFFRYDLVWVKSAPAGFLSAKKMPMRKHEMVYVFYEKLPFYDLSSHKHKFVKERDAKQKNGEVYGGEEGKMLMEGKYEPSLPVSVVKEDSCYGGAGTEEFKGDMKGKYEPPLPVSVVKEDYETCDKPERKTMYGDMKIYEPKRRGEPRYEPALPTSVVKEPEPEPESLDIIKKVQRKSTYGEITTHDIVTGKNNAVPRYEPPLPVSVIKVKEGGLCKNYGVERLYYYDEEGNKLDGSDGTNTKYEPPLPTTMLEIKSTRGKHSTEKPVALMSWILKYYSKEGDVVLDPTMGSGSTGVACKEMNRNFIGIEMDAEIYEVAVNRIEE
jgi:hypothetical protein